MPTGRWNGRREEWSHAGHSLHIKSWYPQSEMAINPTWYQGFVNGVLKVEGNDLKMVKIKLEARAEEIEDGEFGQEAF